MKITKIERNMLEIPKKKRVAAYARVSMESERLMHSLSAQISYYNDLIQNNPEWEFAGVYADSFISGTEKTKRTEFNRLIADCEQGSIDIVLCKSISRFARNTVDLLETVRHLKELGISIRFEKENIDSLSGDGEVMLTLLASFAQEESRSISDNVKWGTRKRFEQGIPNGRHSVYGYEWEGDTLIIVPEEAAVVKRIFQNFLDGKSRLETERELAAEGITTRNGYRWVDSTIKVILTNVTYTGNMLLQKEYVVDPLTHKKKKNKGELPQYYVENTHEAIIDKETFDFVQAEMKRRRELGALANKHINATCFTSKIKCPYCGVSYMHCRRSNNDFWLCGTVKADEKHRHGKKCPVGGIISDKQLRKVCAEVFETEPTEPFDEQKFLDAVEFISVPKRYIVEFHFRDGRIITKECKSTGHKDCWTEELRAQRAAYMTEKPNCPNQTEFTAKIKCMICDCNFIRTTQWTGKKEPRKVAYWRCRVSGKGCVGIGFREDVLKCMTSEILGDDEYDVTHFTELIDHIEVNGTTIIYFHFKDGSVKIMQYLKPTPRKGVRNGTKNSDNDTGIAETLHSTADTQQSET